MDTDEDPGWRQALASSWKMLVPGLQQRHAAQAIRRGDAAIDAIRMLWLAFTLGPAWIGGAVLVLSLGADLATTTTTSSTVALAMVVAGSIASLGVGSRLARRSLDCSSLATLAASYRQCFFLRVAVAEAAAIVAFTGFVISGIPWLYLIGLAVTWWQLSRIAPTTAHLAVDQEWLRGRDCQLRLLDALALPATPRSDGRTVGRSDGRTVGRSNQTRRSPTEVTVGGTWPSAGPGHRRDLAIGRKWPSGAS